MGAVVPFDEESFADELVAQLAPARPAVDTMQDMLANATRGNIEMLEKQRDLALSGIKNDFQTAQDAASKALAENQQRIDMAMKIANDCAAAMKAINEDSTNRAVASQKSIRDATERFEKMIADQREVLRNLEKKPLSVTIID